MLSVTIQSDISYEMGGGPVADVQCTGPNTTSATIETFSCDIFTTAANGDAIHSVSQVQAYLDGTFKIISTKRVS